MQNLPQLTNWRIIKKVQNGCYLNRELIKRYGYIYEKWIDTVKGYDSICNSRDYAWIYTDDIFSPASNIAFKWDYAERLELESCRGDSEIQEINEKWDNLLPIALYVGGEYTYWAISTSGVYVFGCIIDGSEITEIGNSDADFINHIANYVS